MGGGHLSGQVKLCRGRGIYIWGRKKRPESVAKGGGCDLRGKTQRGGDNSLGDGAPAISH